MNATTIFPLSSSLDALLASGGDDRVSVDESLGLNKYGCSPFPDTLAAYGYTTASNISSGAYRHVSAIYNDLQTIESNLLNDWAESHFRSFRSCLAGIYGLKNGEKFIFGASGTDLELIALWACVRSGKQVENIVVGSAETGSGINYVCNGMYHQSTTVLGKTVRVGEKIPGFENMVASSVHIPIREPNGSERPSRDVVRDIKAAFEKASGECKHSLIHVVHGSKTGLKKPDFDDLQHNLESMNGTYDVVVDACQGRISPAKLQQYLAAQCMVIFTGSKFFGGPPFSGALILPESIAVGFKKPMPVGLRDFFTETEFCDVGEQGVLGAKSINVGLILRWEAALYEIKRYFSVPEKQRAKVMEEFSRAINMFRKHSSLYRMLDTELLGETLGHNPLELKSIYTFELCARSQSTSVSNKNLAADLYHSLHRDISRLVPIEYSTIGQYRIQVGQPVEILQDPKNGKPNLRLSLGAPLISDLHFLGRREIFCKFISDFNMLERKTKLILEMNGIVA